MPDHGSVQSVLGHYCTSAPALLRFAPLGSPVLEPNLQHTKIHSSTSIFEQDDEILPREHIKYTQGQKFAHFTYISARKLASARLSLISGSARVKLETASADDIIDARAGGQRAAAKMQ